MGLEIKPHHHFSFKYRDKKTNSRERHSNNMACYEGHTDLYELSEELAHDPNSAFLIDPSSHKVHHNDEQSNFGNADFDIIHGESNNLSPPASVEPLAPNFIPQEQQQSLGTQFVDTAQYASRTSNDDISFIDEFLMESNGMTNVEM